MGSTPPVKLEEGYSIWKGLKKGLVSTVIPALGVMATGFVLDPGFMSWVQAHAGTGAVGAGVSLVLAMLVNWAKNRNK